MLISPIVLVIALILTIFCAIIVPVLLFLRQVTMRGEITDAVHKVGLMHKDYTMLLAENNTLNQKINEIKADLIKVDALSITTQETLRSFSNKLASRERVENQRRKKEEREEVTTDDENIHQIGIPLFEQKPAEVSQPPQRKFGVMP